MNINDERIIEFSKYSVDDIYLPREFKYEEPKWLIYAAGDGMGTYYSRNTDMTNIESFSKKGYNIFCCVDYSERNIKYLNEHPELNVILCIIEGNENDYPKFNKLFKDSIDLIDSDDRRFYMDSDVAYNILTTNGICLNVSSLIRNGSKIKRAYTNTGRPFTSGQNIKSDKGWTFPKFAEVQEDMYVKLDMNGGRKQKRKTKTKTRKQKKSFLRFSTQ